MHVNPSPSLQQPLQSTGPLPADGGDWSAPVTAEVDAAASLPGDATTPASEPHLEARVRSSERVRSWRRRVLFRRGATIHAAMGRDAANCSLAMLDETGVVVSWYGRIDGNDRPAERVTDRHVSQFYLAQDIASEQPLRDLHEAVAAGSHVRQGWRLRAQGNAVWSRITIEAVALRDGRLQGFSYLMQDCDRPSDHLPIGQSLDVAPEQRQGSLSARGSTVLSVRNRMAKINAYARQHRVFRLVMRGMHN